MPPLAASVPDLLNYFTVEDFSPGIQQRVNRQGAAVSPSSTASAATTNTFRCIALPGGGLGPLPRATSTYTPAVPASMPVGTSFNNAPNIVGFFIANPVYGTVTGVSPSEFHIAYETVTSATTRRFVWERHRMWEASPTIDAIKTIASAEVSPVSNFRRCFYDSNRMDPSNPQNNGVPVVGAAWYVSTGGFEKFWSVFPNPSTPAAAPPNVFDISTGLAADYLFAHQNRFVIFEQRAIAHTNVASWAGNENVWFTNSNLPTISGSTATTFAPETYSGYIFGASTNASEMFVAKIKGGGYVIRGDLSTSATVLRLPGIIARVPIGSRPAWTPIGLIYIAGSEGAFLWSGGDQSQKISQALEDNFWDVGSLGTGKSQTAAFNMLTGNGDCERWGDWVVFTMNWLYDTRSNSWWRLEDPSVRQYAYWQAEGGAINAQNNNMWGMIGYNNGSDTVGVCYNKSLGATTYRWQSQPIAPSLTNVIDCREVILTAQGTGTVTITLTGLNAGTDAATFTVSGSVPLRQRANMFLQATHIQVQIDATGTGGNAAPIIYDVSVGFHDKANIASIN